jgi:RNA polymerase sigma-70 factor (ECF subfamily)
LGKESQPPRGSVTYCVVPWALGEKLHEPLRRHFAEDPSVEVVVERRTEDRRSTGERRRAASDVVCERRVIRSITGRRVADQRAPQMEVPPPPALPRRALRYADRLRFIERAAPTDQHLEDIDTARLVMRFQAGEHDVFSELYLRYFDRVYSYMRLALRDGMTAEDACQQVFTNLLDALPRYERRGAPFRGYLFTIVRNTAVDRLRDANRVEPIDAEELEALRVSAVDSRSSEKGFSDTLAWVSDPDLMLFIERLPVVQQQVLFMRFMLDLSHREIAQLLDRREDDVRAVQYRALQFLRERLTAVGRDSVRSPRAPMKRYLAKTNVLRARRFALR